MMQEFPGLIDIHVHLRDPGSTHKEDFFSGAKAAVAGGFTTILDMPNNTLPTFNEVALEDKIQRSVNPYCQIGFHFGTDGNNLNEFNKAKVSPKVYGLKIYCNHTTGNYMVTEETILASIFSAWESEKPILVHAEGEMAAVVLALAKQYHRRLHICHVSLAKEVALIRQAKKQGVQVSAGVCPHHLFITETMAKSLGSLAVMKPPIPSEHDRSALWEGLEDLTIDIVESDHAPHTREEKASSQPPFGVPGLETTLGLLLKAVKDQDLSLSTVRQLLYERPKALFHIPDDDCVIQLDPDTPYLVGETGYFSKADWSPFHGWELYGKVKEVRRAGQLIYQEGTFL